MYGKLDRYLLIALVAIGLIALYFLFTNHKKGNDRDNLLVAMARKLGANDFDGSEPEEKKQSQKTEAKAAPTEEEEVQITNIADKLCFSKALTQEEAQFQKRFQQEILDELNTSRKVLGILINKFMSGVKEFDTFEQEFYTANQQEIDTIVHSRKVLDSVVSKIIEGRDDFTAEELQSQQTYPQYIEHALAQIKAANPNVKTPAAFTDQSNPPGAPAGPQLPAADSDPSLTKANPPMAAGERLKLILSFFEDKIPKNITQIANLYAQETKTKAHTGNISTTVGTLVEEGKLMCVKAGKNNKVYHGPPQWFDKKRMKEEYLKNIK